MCGGTHSGHPVRLPASGLSPRVRGNRLRARRLHAFPRSIPACAGEPCRTLSTLHCPPVYPRVCGGTADTHNFRNFRNGLSPRVRGNPLTALTRMTLERSIPACAGEPSIGKNQPQAGQVYPRVCGGTSSRACRMNSKAGLSPRVRGNPLASSCKRASPGSIPACAGEPGFPCTPSSTVTVYPRVCGGTAVAFCACSLASGLSPRVRGNRLRQKRDNPVPGSIPACAGEPRAQMSSTSNPSVYPRVCGGTHPFHSYQPSFCGLSPRVRGNPRNQPTEHTPYGSIPACAGEPDCVCAAVTPPSVYPRVCGGTSTLAP